MKPLLDSLRALTVFTLLLGVGYPLFVTVGAKLFFKDQAQGSLIRTEKGVTGSYLLAQKVTNPRYFSPRPSASDYGALPSGASNLGPTSAALKEAVGKIRAENPQAPVELLTTSGSGLDPHLGLEAVWYQSVRVAAARKISESELIQWVKTQTEAPDFGFLGAARLNVMRLNRDLDKRFP